MTDFTKVKKNLERAGYHVETFNTAKEAADYIDGELDGKTIGFGGSATLKTMGLYEILASHNDVHWHWQPREYDEDPDQGYVLPATDERIKSTLCDVYISSVSGLAETGEMVNVDGNGNRLAGTLWGHKKVIFVVGRNKLAPDYESAVYRCRNVACVLRAKDFDGQPACVKAGSDRCYDCKSPDRICNAMVTYWRPMTSAEETEVILVDEDLGY